MKVYKIASLVANKIHHFRVGLKFSDEERFCSPYLFHSSGIHQSKAECKASNLTDTFQVTRIFLQIYHFGTEFLLS